MRVLRGSLAVLLLLVAGRAADAAPVTFNFEALNATGVTSLVDTQGGLTITITRTSGAVFGLQDLSGFGPAFGSRSLDPFQGGHPTGDAFVVDFSAPITSFSIDFADFNQDDDTPVTATAYAGLGGTGLVVGSDAEVWLGSDTFPAFKTLSISGLGINSVLFTNVGGGFPNSLYWDNLVADVEVPEPASLALFSLGALGLAGYRARRRQTAV